MIISLAVFALVSMGMLCGHMPASAAVTPVAMHPVLEPEPSSTNAPQLYRVDDESNAPNKGLADSQSSQDELSTTKQHLQSAKQKIEELERQLKQRIGELVLQLHAKDTEITALRSNAVENSKKLRDDFSSQAEELTQAKRRVAELEQQIAASGKGQELVQAKRRAAEAEQLTAKKEQDLTQIKRRVAEVEQQTVGKEQELAQVKRRVSDVEQQMAGKEQELAQAKHRAADAEQLTARKEQELTQAKRRVTEVEQQLAGKEQELAQAKRRAAEVEQQMASTGKDQDLAQAKRRVAETEQQAAKKEQELAQVKDDLRQVTQRLADINPQLMAKDAELARTKQLLVDFESHSPKQAEPTPAQEESPPPLPLQSIDQSLSVTTLLGSNPEATDDGDTFTLIANGDLTKISESLASLLQPELKKGSATLRQRGNRLTLALATGELFSTGDATVTLGGTSLLERIGALLHGFRYQNIDVVGHTDNTPLRSDLRKSFRDNLEFSRARAEHAIQVLVTGGLEVDRVKAVGYADTKPIATNDTEKGRSKNRRLEIVITQTAESGITAGGRKSAGR